MECPNCGSDQLNKNGLTAAGSERYRCKKCSKQFTVKGLQPGRKKKENREVKNREVLAQNNREKSVINREVLNNKPHDTHDKKPHDTHDKKPHDTHDTHDKNNREVSAPDKDLRPNKIESVKIESVQNKIESEIEYPKYVPKTESGRKAYPEWLAGPVHNVKFQSWLTPAQKERHLATEFRRFFSAWCAKNRPEIEDTSPISPTGEVSPQHIYPSWVPESRQQLYLTWNAIIGAQLDIELTQAVGPAEKTQILRQHFMDYCYAKDQSVSQSGPEKNIFRKGEDPLAGHNMQPIGANMKLYSPPISDQ